VYFVISLVMFYDSLSVPIKGSGLEYGTYRLFQKSMKQLPACTAQRLSGAVAATAQPWKPEILWVLSWYQNSFFIVTKIHWLSQDW